MNEMNKIEAVTERDIDLLLLEELNVSPDFSSWFYSKVTHRDDAPLLVGVWHSVTDAALGESDLLAIYGNGHAVLIENKIDAAAQPEQGERYIKRGQKGIDSALWDSFSTCMVAPDLYFQKERDAKVYDETLSYEVIAEWFSSRSGDLPRNRWKRYLFTEAIEQNRRGYTIIPDERVTDFWESYWLLAQEKFPELEMKQPGLKPANADWPVFLPAALNKQISIVHKLNRGDVDMQIQAAAEKIEPLKKLLTNYDVEVVKAGRSAAVRLKVPLLKRESPFDAQRDKVEEGLRASTKLLAIALDVLNGGGF